MTILPDYIVYHWGVAGVIRRFDGSEGLVVAYLHCPQEEARQIARDLHAPFSPSYFEQEGVDCPTECSHADEWKHTL